MSYVYVYEGVEYRKVKRKAKVGEKIVVVYPTASGSQYRAGFVGTVLEVREKAVMVSGVSLGILHYEYCVLEPIQGEEATVDQTQASPAVIDMLANLARRVTQLESQLRATQRNLETFAEQTESNTQDIAQLDERTQVINAIAKFYEEANR
jgi:hypothetical protein